MSNYWERRAVWDLYKNLDNAEATADLIAKVYRSASMNLTYAAKDIFEKYMTKHKLSETEVLTRTQRVPTRQMMQIKSCSVHFLGSTRSINWTIRPVPVLLTVPVLVVLPERTCLRH